MLEPLKVSLLPLNILDALRNLGGGHLSHHVGVVWHIHNWGPWVDEGVAVIEGLLEHSFELFLVGIGVSWVDSLDHSK